MNKTDLQNIVKELSQKRPVFHSEADFQFALACEIVKKFPNANIRLERPFGYEMNKYLDILVQINDGLYPIELKYKTAKLNTDTITINGDEYRLKTHGARDLNAYDCLKDIQRIEELSEIPEFKLGFVVWLVNDSAYWKEPRNPNANYADFAIYEGALKTGRMSWRNNSKSQSLKTRRGIELRNRYQINWRSYSNLGVNVKNGEFRYALLSIESSQP